MAKPYDLAVIGGGPAGLSIADVAPRLGIRVALIEAARLGGDCTWAGCVPSKALLAAANAHHRAGRTERFGLPRFEASAAVDLGSVMDRIHDHQQAIFERADAPDLLRARGVDVIEGRATFEAPDRLLVDGRELASRYVVVATGASAVVPPVPGLANAGYLTNETIWSLRVLPHRLLVIGAGVVGLELGQAFARLGSAVTIVEAAIEVLPALDRRLGAALRAALEADGVTIRTATTVRAIETRATGSRAILEGRDGRTELPFDQVLVAAGRVPQVEGLGLEAAGIAFDRVTGITVDRNMRTSNPRVYAAGDVVPGPRLTHLAALEGVSALMASVLLLPRPIDPRLTPAVTYTDPETATIGATEAEARARWGDAVRVHRSSLAESDRATVEQAAPGFVQVVTRGKHDRIEGAQIVAPAAGELIHEFALAMRQGLGLRDLAELPHAYPSYAVSAQLAAVEATHAWLAGGKVRRYASLARRVPNERLRETLRAILGRLA
ncbi:MAG: FAD-dependent oxidoreductase [Chloroflexi bacterium]|nr:FAD-dependent oxidoreductase [Chloroflexota bacterium]MDA1145291.1 FAD-dependent oxidoreductase [Chloroflexota bacterium]